MTLLPIDALGGARLNLSRSGCGPTLLALHGFSGSSANWEELAAATDSEFDFIGVDLLGHGFSDSPADPRFYSLERTVAGLAELLDRLTLERVHWLGYSMGGRVALCAALKAPGRALSLVVESGSPGLRTETERAARAKDDSALANWLEGVGVEAFVDYWQSLPMWASQRRLPRAVLDRLRAQRLSNSAVGLANSLRGLGVGAQPSLHELLPGLTAPALFIAGEKDAKFAAIAGEMHRMAPRSRLRIIAGAGHTVHLEQPERFNKEVLGLLRTVGRPAGNVPKTPQDLPSPLPVPSLPDESEKRKW